MTYKLPPPNTNSIANKAPRHDWLPRAPGRWVFLAAASIMLIGCRSTTGSSMAAATWHEPLDYLAGLRGEG